MRGSLARDAKAHRQLDTETGRLGHDPAQALFGRAPDAFHAVGT